MKAARKWKKHLLSVGYPWCEKLSNDNIIDLIYTNHPARLDVLRWIAHKIRGNDDSCFNMGRDELGNVFGSLGLLKTNPFDFVDAMGTKEEQKQTWKALFSYTRMRCFFTARPEDQRHFRDCFKKQVSNESTKLCPVEEFEFESDDDQSINIKEELEEVRLEMMKRQKSKSTYETESPTRETSVSTGVTEEDHSDSNKKVARKEEFKFYNAFKPMLYTPNIDEYLANRRMRIDESRSVFPRVQESIETENVPRLFIPHGAPPLGQLDKDAANLKVKVECSAPPISATGQPHSDLSSWQYKVYDIKQ